MLDTGHPVQIKIVGDVEKASPYVGLAKKKVREFAAKRNKSRNIGTEWGQLDDGIEYKATITGNHWSVVIFAEGCTVGDRGAFSEKLPYYNQYTGEWMFPQANADQWVVDYKKDDKGEYVLDNSGKRTVVATGFVEIRNKKKPLPHQAVHLGSGYSGPEGGLRNFVMDELRFLHKYKASKYSGTMRKVVQMLLSKGFKQLKTENIAGGDYTAPTFIFNYKFEETHGIYISKKNKEWWVIKIDRNGVFRRRATWCKVSLNGRDDVRYFTGYAISYDKDGNPLEEDKQWTKLGSVGNFYSMGSVFSACGWAFSPDGSFAQNVGVNPRKMGAVYQTYYEMQRWKISISEDPETGIPSAATSSMVEVGVIWNSDRIAMGIGHFQVPDDDQGACVTFDYNLGNFGEPPGEVGGPLYVYYSDTGEEVIVRSSRAKAKDMASENVTRVLTNVSVYTAGGTVVTRPEQMFGTDAAPESIDSGPASVTYTTSSATSEVISSTKFNPTVITEGHGGYTRTWYQVVSTGIVMAASYVYAFLTSVRDGYARSGTAPDYNYCFQNETNITQGSWAIPMQGFTQVCRIAYKTEDEDQREVRTDCAGCIPYGERQAIILSSWIFHRGYTVSSSTTGMIGYQHDYSYFAVGPWASDGTKACYQTVGDIGPGPNSDPTAVHWAGTGSTYHYFPYLDSGWYYRSVRIIDVYVNNETGIYGIGRLRGKVGVVSGASNSVQAQDWSTRQVVEHDATEPAPRTRYRYDGYGTTYTYNFSSIDSSSSAFVPHRYTYSAGLIGPTGQVISLDAAAWAGTLIGAYHPDNLLFVYASFDAFDGANKHAYSHNPNSSATVTYPGVTSYTAEGCFGFVGYEDTSNGT